jgi:DNA gyrase/topoisomerase IV subunit A
MVNKAQLVERIAEIVIARKLPQLLDVKDTLDGDVRIAIEIKKDADEKMVMAYSSSTRTAGQLAVNLTCLIPTETPTSAAPSGRSKQILWHFCLPADVVTRRLEHEPASLAHPHLKASRRSDALDEIIRIIRKPTGKRIRREAWRVSSTPTRPMPSSAEDLPAGAPRRILIIRKESGKRARGDLGAAEGRRQPLEGGPRRPRDRLK